MVDLETPVGSTTTTPATAVSAEAFGEMVDPYRHELLVHCYRMLGSIDDAEDAVQDALLRAWHGLHTFRRDISFRAWLYRIATNACLDAIERRTRGGRAALESLGVGPYPDDLLGEMTAGPEARYESHESISLAFLTALQVLPARQRAVLILRDVLSWRATEVAELLDLTVPAVNSSLHRARSTVSDRYQPAGRGDPTDRTRGQAGGQAGGRPGSTEKPGLRSLLERYVRAWEMADVAGLVALLRDDAVVSMPPGVIVAGAAAIAAFLQDSVFVDGMRIRLVPVRANLSPAFVVYSAAGTDPALLPYAVVLVDTDGTRIARMSVFADPRLVARFGVPDGLAG